MRALLFPPPPSAAAAARVPYRGRKGSDERYSGFLAQVETVAFAAAVGRSSLLGLGRCVCRRCLLIKSASACSSMSFPFRLPHRRLLLRWVAADLSRLPSRCWYCSSPHPLSLHHSDEIKRPSTVRVAASALIRPTPQLLPHHPVTLHLPAVLDWTDINLCSSTASKMKGTAPKNSDGG